MSDLTNTLSRYLTSKDLKLYSNLWRIQPSNIEGNGVYANRDIEVGEIIFKDHPLVLGPRAGVNVKLHCVICGSTSVRACDGGCGLPICGVGCEASHKEECGFIRKKQLVPLKEVSQKLFRSLTPLRAFLLNEPDHQLFELLARNEGPAHGFEIAFVNEFLHLTENEKTFMKLVCCVLDSNAFETIIQSPNNVQTSVRGLYPLGSLMNHSCTPNTMHLFNNAREMIVKAATRIPKDTEILTTYTTLLWATPARRVHLATTKHFWCACARCKDPNEFGAGLNGLKCVQSDCSGGLFPQNPLDISSKWECDGCKAIMSCRKIGMVQSVLGSFLKMIDTNDPEKIIDVITNKLDKVVPPSNHIAIELKLRLIWALGSANKSLQKEIHKDYKVIKETFINDVLQVVSTLRLGQCKLRGLLLYEQYRCKLDEASNNSGNNFREEFNQLLQEAVAILEHDVTAPKDILTIS